MASSKSSFVTLPFFSVVLTIISRISLISESGSEILLLLIHPLMMLSVTFIAAGGYVINDYFDIKIDRINKPDQLIVTQSVTKDAAMHCHQLLTILGAAMGLVVAWWCRSWGIGLTMILVPGLLWFYSSSYKRQFIIGNVIVAFLAAMPSLVVAMANVGYLQRRYGDILVFSPVNQDLYFCGRGGFGLHLACY